MPTLYRYRPAYFSGFPDEQAEVNSLEEIIAIPWVKSWAEMDGFYRFSLSDDRLMCELNAGDKWWVVARLSDVTSIDLPKWKAPK